MTMTAPTSDEKPRHPVTLATYAIGRYPVTNAEYACFLAAGGYEDEAYWTEGGATGCAASRCRARRIRLTGGSHTGDGSSESAGIDD